ncbi:hypothetical protein HanXRQr2_Chr16g0723851 [Helianthus annuus]|uniref:Uncharacterized protein n=1 Tax=Helianthus annuus TaxID=4232 RepID=A0A251RVQ7_HELAN|nr:hypothetical protein HanXRQr2_Chr16g0723851 [Helianthus annuus]
MSFGRFTLYHSLSSQIEAIRLIDSTVLTCHSARNRVDLYRLVVDEHINTTRVCSSRRSMFAGICICV